LKETYASNIIKQQTKLDDQSVHHLMHHLFINLLELL